MALQGKFYRLAELLAFNSNPCNNFAADRKDKKSVPTKLSDRETAYHVETRLMAAVIAEFGEDAVVCQGELKKNTIRVILTIDVTKVRRSEPQTLRDRFDRFAPALGLVPSDFDLPLRCFGKPAFLVDIRPIAPKYAMLIEMVDGARQYRVPAGIFVIARKLRAAQQLNEQNSAARLPTAGA